MINQSDNFEKKISRIHTLVSNSNEKVVSNNYIPDPDNPTQRRQIDITIERDGKLHFIECRFHKAKQDVKWIEELGGRKISLNAASILAVSSSGFTKGAILKADKFDIKLRDLVSLSEDEVKCWGTYSEIFLVFYKYREVSLEVDLENGGIKFYSQDELKILLKEKNIVPDTFSMVKKKLSELNLSDDVRKQASVTYEMYPKDPTIGDFVIKKITFRAKVSAVNEYLKINIMDFYGEPKITADKRNVVVENYLMDGTEVIRSEKEVTAVLDLESMEVPENCQWGSVRFNFPDPVNFKFFSIRRRLAETIPNYELVINVY
jgi:hypothetical protein